MFASVLPGGEHTPGYPFSGFVVNINVVTIGHRDVKDFKACLVLVIGDHTGGELCLVEPGIVLRLRSSDFVVFPSEKISHFNLHYEGVRASIVLHTDREGVSYAEASEWEKNQFFG